MPLTFNVYYSMHDSRTESIGRHYLLGEGLWGERCRRSGGGRAGALTRLGSGGGRCTPLSGLSLENLGSVLARRITARRDRRKCQWVMEVHLFYCDCLDMVSGYLSAVLSMVCFYLNGNPPICMSGYVFVCMPFSSPPILLPPLP